MLMLLNAEMQDKCRGREAKEDLPDIKLHIIDKVEDTQIKIISYLI